MNLKRCCFGAIAAALVFGSSTVSANDFVFHGKAVAEVNKHGHLVLTVDRFVGPDQPEDGVADVVFIFAADDHDALLEAAQSLSRESSRLNLDHARLEGGAVLKVNLPTRENFWLVVEHTVEGVSGPESSSLVSATRLDGLALSEVDVTAKAWSMTEAIEYFRDFDILNPS